MRDDRSRITWKEPDMDVARRKFLSIVGSGLMLGISSLIARQANAADPCGRWVGEWTSCTTGHHGPLRARLSKDDCGTYSAFFTGRFMAVLPFAYRVPLKVVGHDEEGTAYLSGSARLPLFGQFCCKAQVTCCCFTATYTASNDRGKFVLSRK